MGLDWNDRRRFKGDTTREQDLKVLKAMVYGLCVVKIHVLSLEDPAVATGSMVCRVLEGPMSLLALLSRGAACLNSEELHKISVFESEMSPESLTLCKPRSKVRRKVIALLLMEAIESQLDHTMMMLNLWLSFFDPL